MNEGTEMLLYSLRVALDCRVIMLVRVCAGFAVAMTLLSSVQFALGGVQLAWILQTAGGLTLVSCLCLVTLREQGRVQKLFTLVAYKPIAVWRNCVETVAVSFLQCAPFASLTGVAAAVFCSATWVMDTSAQQGTAQAVVGCR